MAGKKSTNIALKNIKAKELVNQLNQIKNHFNYKLNDIAIVNNRRIFTESWYYNKILFLANKNNPMSEINVDAIIYNAFVNRLNSLFKEIPIKSNSGEPITETIKKGIGVKTKRIKNKDFKSFIAFLEDVSDKPSINNAYVVIKKKSLMYNHFNNEELQKDLDLIRKDALAFKKKFILQVDILDEINKYLGRLDRILSCETPCDFAEILYNLRNAERIFEPLFMNRIKDK